LKLVRAFVLAATALLASCADTRGTQDVLDPRLVPATETADRAHLIVTVPLDQPTALAEIAGRLERNYPVRLVAEWPLGAIGVHCFVFRVAAGADPERLARTLVDSEEVTAAQQMQEFRPLAGVYTDEHVGLQESLLAINALNAHRLATGKDVRVAVVDTGVDVSHPDLAARIATARDFVGTGSDPPPRELHGTAIAGVIAADATNGMGIVGVAPEAQVMALRGCWQERATGRCSSFSLARAMNYAVLNDADVMNLSLAGPHDPLLATLIDAALARGTIVVAADGTARLGGFPATVPGVIAAAATSVETEGVAHSVPAPAIDVLTTAPGGGFDFSSGPSIAAAHVSGVVALMLQRAPDLTPDEVYAALMNSMQSRDGQTDPVLDACRAVQLVLKNGTAPAC